MSFLLLPGPIIPSAMVRSWQLFILPCVLSTLAGAANEEFEVNISPQMMAVKRGESVWFNCSSTCKSTASLSLEARHRKVKGSHGPGWKSEQFLNITGGMSYFFCSAICNGTTKKAEAVIFTYKDILLKLEKSPPSRNHHQAYNLTCQVLEITPALRNLNLTLLKGAERLHSWTFGNDTNVGLVNRTVTSPLTPKPRDHGKEATCHVTLDLQPDEQVMIPTSPRLELRTAETYRGVLVAISSMATLAAELLGFLTYCLISR